MKEINHLSIVESKIKEAKKIVDESYKALDTINEIDDFKFTQPMIMMIAGNIALHDKDQSAKELINDLISSPITSRITRFYLAQCQNKLKIYDPREVRENLIKLNFL